MATATANLPATAPANGLAVAIDQEAVLRHLGLNPRDAATQALLLTCSKYGLDPILKHALLIQGRLYVTRDGLLHVAHRSGQLDGIVVEDQSETDTHFVARVSVYRKDMSRPFTYVGRFPRQGKGPVAAYGPEMAVKCGEVMALRRAFDVSLCAREEMWDADDEPPTPARAAIEAPSRAAAAAEWDEFAANTLDGANASWEAELEDAGLTAAKGWEQLCNPFQLDQHIAGVAVAAGAEAPEKRTAAWARDLARKLWRRKPDRVIAEVEAYLKARLAEGLERHRLSGSDPAGDREPGEDG